MNNILRILGAIFLVIILMVAAIMGYLVYTGNKLDASNKAYVDESVPAIISTWSKDELIKRASQQLREKTPDDQVDQLFTSLSSKLGTFQSYDGAKGQSNMSITSKEGEAITAAYVANATFKNGKTEIQIKLIRNNNSWQILGFHVELRPL